MKWFFLFFLQVIFLAAKGQADSGETFYFEGYVLSEDSVPAEHAYLVSYRTLKAYSTNQDGFFSIPALPCDSFAVAHVSFEKRVLIANTLPADSNQYKLIYSVNEIGMVDIKLRDRERENFEINIAQIKEELSGELYLSRNSDWIHNSYAPPKPPLGYVNFNFPEIIDRIIQNRKRLKRKLDELLNEE